MTRRRDSNTDGKRLPARPTRHLPGSAGKIRALRRRAARGEKLWHPLDATLGEDGLARVPVLSRGNYRIIRLRVVNERDWLARLQADEEEREGGMD